VSIRMDNQTDSFNILTSFNSFIHPVIRSYCPSGFRGSFILLSVWLQGRLHFSFNIYQLHRERAVTGRIFQALPTQTDTTVALIYRILFICHLLFESLNNLVTNRGLTLEEILQCDPVSHEKKSCNTI